MKRKVVIFILTVIFPGYIKTGSGMLSNDASTFLSPGGNLFLPDIPKYNMASMQYTEKIPFSQAKEEIFGDFYPLIFSQQGYNPDEDLGTFGNLLGELLSLPDLSEDFLVTRGNYYVNEPPDGLFITEYVFGEYDDNKGILQFGVSGTGKLKGIQATWYKDDDSYTIIYFVFQPTREEVYNGPQPIPEDFKRSILVIKQVFKRNEETQIWEKVEDKGFLFLPPNIEPYLIYRDT